MKISSLECTVIDATLAAAHPLLAALRHRWGNGGGVARRYTGVGVYLTIEVGSNAPTAPIKRLLLGDVIVVLPRKTDAMGSLAYIEDGRLTCLEMHTLDMLRPQDVSGFVVKHATVPRSYETLDAEVHA